MKNLVDLLAIVFNFLYPAHTITAASNALVKYTAIVDNISGKLNGSVFARNKGGAYIRSKSNPTNPQTSSQMAQRATFGGVSQLWRNLTPSQRSNWDATAADYPYQNSLGDTKILSGFALHQQLNSNLSVIGQPTVSAPLAPKLINSPESANVLTNTSAALAVQANFTGVDTGDGIVAIYATDGMSAGISNFKKRLRLIDASSLTADYALSKDLYAAYTALFDAPITGAKIGFKMVVIDNITGQASAPLYFESITT